MFVFLDFEASSLAKTGFPIEVAWVFEDGRSESHLIRPASGWTEWDPAAEAIHGISRTELMAEGEPHEAVARRMVDTLSAHRLFASAPSWDGKWLSALLRAAGLPRHSLRLQDTELARRERAMERLCPPLRGAELEATVARVLAEVAQAHDRHPARHRAVDDAEQERCEWLLAGELAEAARARRAA